MEQYYYVILYIIIDIHVFKGLQPIGQPSVGTLNGQYVGIEILMVIIAKTFFSYFYLLWNIYYIYFYVFLQIMGNPFADKTFENIHLLMFLQFSLQIIIIVNNKWLLIRTSPFESFLTSEGQQLTQYSIKRQKKIYFCVFSLFLLLYIRIDLFRLFMQTQKLRIYAENCWDNSLNYK